MELKGLELIKAYNADRSRFMPMYYYSDQTGSRNDWGGANIGWYAGLLEENRPFFADCWGMEGATMLTLYVSAEGIGEITATELEHRFEEAGYYRRLRTLYSGPSLTTITDREGNVFLALNLMVGEDEDPALIDGAPVLPYRILNEYNSAPDQQRTEQ